MLFAPTGVPAPALGAPYRVDGEFVQLGLGNGFALTAGRGAEFLIETGGADESGDLMIRVDWGPVLALDLEGNRAFDLAPGRYRLARRLCEADCRQDKVIAPTDVGTASAPSAALLESVDSRQEYRLTDLAMTQQQALRDKFGVPTATVNRFLSRLLRGVARWFR